MRVRTAPPVPRPLRGMLTLLSVLAALALSGQETEAGPQRFVRVKVDVANLRARPSTAAKQVRYAYENEPLHVVSQQGRWLKVRDAAGEAAWIFAPLTDGRSGAVVLRDTVNVRTAPGTGNPIAFTAERGVNLLVLGREGRWLHVRHDVGEGWIHESLVWGPP